MNESNREPEARNEEGILETAVSVVTQPVVTLRRVTQQQRVSWAIVLVAVLSGAGAIVESAKLSPSDFAIDPSDAADSFEGGARIGLVVGAVILGPLVGLIATALFSGVVHLVGKLLGGSGTFAGLFVGVAFASVPSAIGLPAALLPLVIGSAGGTLSGLVQLCVGVWSIVLVVIAVRENYDFTTGRAVVALLVPVGVLVLGLILLVVAIIVLLAAVAMDVEVASWVR